VWGCSGSCRGDGMASRRCWQPICIRTMCCCPAPTVTALSRPRAASARWVRSGGSWVLIDPKPYLGDPHYDVLQHMFNDVGRLTADPSAFAERMARLTGLDPRRVRRWLLARCVQEAGVIEGASVAALRL